jgi:hypothetical protein
MSAPGGYFRLSVPGFDATEALYPGAPASRVAAALQRVRGLGAVEVACAFHPLSSDFPCAPSDPLAPHPGAPGVGAALYSNGPEDTAELYADASAVADSAEFKMLSLRAFCAAGASGHSSSYSTQDKTLRVWRAILAFVERDPQEHAKLVDVTVILQDPAHKTVAAAVLPTLLRPSLRLLTAISPSVQRGDLMAFAVNYAAAAQRMAQGLKPGQCAYFTMARQNRRQTGAESTKSAESVEAAEAAEATKEQEPIQSPRKRARTDSTNGLSVGHSGRESTVV